MTTTPSPQAAAVHPEADTWQMFSDKHLLPDAIFYGNRLISLERIFDVAKARTAWLNSVRGYKVVFDHYVAEADIPTGVDGEFSPWDDGYATGVQHALELLRVEFNLPVPVPPMMPKVAARRAADQTNQ